MLRSIQGSLASYKSNFIRKTFHFRLSSTGLSINKTNSSKKSSLGSDIKNLGQINQSKLLKRSKNINFRKFSVFPSIQDVEPSMLVGATNFGKSSYFIFRSETGNLPVYSEYKNGGKMVTEIRKISGDIIQLRNDLQAVLPQIPKSMWKIIIQSKKIVIGGNYVREVKHALSTTF